ncbi:hypothetical protein BaRGS_00026470, partial [Batillaria attramentaria]
MFITISQRHPSLRSDGSPQTDCAPHIADGLQAKWPNQYYGTSKEVFPSGPSVLVCMTSAEPRQHQCSKFGQSRRRLPNLLASRQSPIIVSNEVCREFAGSSSPDVQRQWMTRLDDKMGTAETPKLISSASRVPPPLRNLAWKPPARPAKFLHSPEF